MNTNRSRIALTALSTSVELVDVLLESLDRIRRWFHLCIGWYAPSLRDCEH